MGIASTLGVRLIGGAFAFGLVRGWRRSLDDRRRQQERTAWTERKRRKRNSEVQALAERYFPFLDKRALTRALAGAGDVVAGLANALRAVPGVVVGEGPWGLPIPIPLAVRTRHAQEFGKTGVGKTALATRVTVDDFENDRNVVIIGQEHSYIHEEILPRIPLRRAHEVIHLSLDPENPTAWNVVSPEEGDSLDVCGLELGHAFRMAMNEPSVGGRTDAITRNLFTALVHYPSASLLSIRPFLEDKSFRSEVLSHGVDSECRAFWLSTYPKFPAGASLPLLVRADQFTSSSQIRRALCATRSTFSLAHALDRGIVLVDFSGLDPDGYRLAASLFLARVQVALMRRDRLPEAERRFVSIVLDEVHLLTTPGSGSEYIFRNLLSRSRRMNAGLLLLTQHSAQLASIRDEVFGNVGTIVSFAVGAKDAATIGRELTVASPENGKLVPLRPESLVSLPIGSGYARIGTGALAIPVKFLPPLERRPVEDGERVKAISWQTFGRKDDSPDISPQAGIPAGAGSERRTGSGSRTALTEAETRFLKAVVRNPGQPSADYARALGLNGSKAAKIRKALVERCLLREHTVARKAQGKPALLLEPLDAALKTLAAMEGERP
jgi:hypothetical protein